MSPDHLGRALWNMLLSDEVLQGASNRDLAIIEGIATIAAERAHAELNRRMEKEAAQHEPQVFEFSKPRPGMD